MGWLGGSDVRVGPRLDPSDLQFHTELGKSRPIRGICKQGSGVRVPEGAARDPMTVRLSPDVQKADQ